MRRTFIVVLAIIMIVTLIGCKSTIIEPKSPDDSLLIGVMTLEAKGWGSFLGASVNGTSKKNIVMKLTNLTTQKEYSLFTYDEGIFYILNPESGKYILQEISFTNNASDGGVRLSAKPDYNLKEIEVVSGKVMNLGVMRWISDSAYKDYRIERLGMHENILNVFKEKFPESLWLQREWVNINL